MDFYEIIQLIINYSWINFTENSSKYQPYLFVIIILEKLIRL